MAGVRVPPCLHAWKVLLQFRVATMGKVCLATMDAQRLLGPGYIEFQPSSGGGEDICLRKHPVPGSSLQLTVSVRFGLWQGVHG